MRCVQGLCRLGKLYMYSFSGPKIKINNCEFLLQFRLIHLFTVHPNVTCQKEGQVCRRMGPRCCKGLICKRGKCVREGKTYFTNKIQNTFQCKKTEEYYISIYDQFDYRSRSSKAGTMPSMLRR